MESYSLIELNEFELKEIDGGREGNFILYVLGYLFVQPGRMAADGAAGHETMGFK